ncbi:carboxypeptidase-like protein [Breznakibacter xylanolyticus]|uniref:Carboxypeptidase-like protein n=1 Tax=Breznakibacter xylanolyticus TaxID=990 RepID=A0A2W7N9T8_9BACT|nr:carboxypeptidase-like regulatory domain-containing protein [Breznakibacter xylanolyticus]PZX16413.1 carboxypeptidase-like protein [Breznakibacter xylanolyticus]
MKATNNHNSNIGRMVFLFVAMMFFTATASATKKIGKSAQADTVSYVQYAGSVVDSQSNDPLTFATLTIPGTNIATVCNSDGEFLLKVPKEMADKSVAISFIGYKAQTLPLSELKETKNKIGLEMINVSLAEINVFPKDPNYLIRAVMSKRDDNYMNAPALMTAFYRETIKKGRTYVSLSEAVVEVLKQPYTNSRPDMVRLFKSRKSADYSKLDTLTFKLMGGPYTTLLMDVMKNPYLVFTDDMIAYYDFSLNNITRIDNRIIYILDFKQKSSAKEPLFFGKLYIDSESLAITSAAFSLNTDYKQEVSEMFIKRKPAGADVYPTEATYLVNYREKDGKWFYGYSRGQINFKVDWTKKWFHTYYSTTIEMAVTDWKMSDEKSIKPSDRLKTQVIMQDAASGFADKSFWGEYNVIEPEQSIESAIKKIQRKLPKE